MEFQKVEDGYLIRLEKDQYLNQTLAQFAIDHKIKSGFFYGLGALKNCELGFYHLNKQEYDRKTFEEEAELLNISGNITWFEGKPIVHSHVTLGNEHFNAFGGHMFESQVAVTVEIHLRVFNTDVERKFRPDIGLNLISFCKIK
jgi:predicted DNA-binding protein with PD1-like motif